VIMVNASTLRFGWKYDSGMGLDVVFVFTSTCEILFSVPVQGWVLVILFLKPNIMRSDIRKCNIADQFTMVLYDLLMCFLFQPYPIFPWPGIYCSGILCQLDFDHRVISVILVTTFIFIVPIFLYLMIRLHSQVTAGSCERYSVSERFQTLIMVSIIALFLLNIICFGLLAVDAENSEELKTVMKDRVFVVSIMLYITIAIIGMFLSALTAHSLHIIKNRASTAHLSHKTIQVQYRLTKVFFLQMVAVVFFFIIPLLTMIYLMTIDTSEWPGEVLAGTRAIIIISLSLKPLTHSLIFLGKNPVLRKQALNQVWCWLTYGGDSTKRNSNVASTKQNAVISLPNERKI
ncbi:hypothetical protein PRIPAC_78006, partial [Pristionchus pacificus]|uniref:G protein-coupled receptor n=1 Tax=Pristionchus pacificus TaxID=54126 RepID=A0A2A6CIV6_PRIPA